ncbi:MAG: hypothetical protein JWR25_2210 [Noviherbaspirillum sp.]|nr:hypothetical protein [Noviherbaspirillum sp.]
MENVIGKISWRSAWAAAACLLAAMLMHTYATYAYSLPPPDEATIKAAYLFKFGNFIEWPQWAFGGSSTFTIGVIGEDKLVDILERTVSHGTVNGRPVTVRRLQVDDPLAGVNMLFIGRTYSRQLDRVLAVANGYPVLTVTEVDKGLASGSMINFVVVDGKLRFEVAPKMAERRDLVISARLLVAAYKVDSGQ